MKKQKARLARVSNQEWNDALEEVKRLIAWRLFGSKAGTDWCATLVPFGVLRWYRFKRCGGTDSSATMVPFRRYYQFNLDMEKAVYYRC